MDSRIREAMEIVRMVSDWHVQLYAGARYECYFCGRMEGHADDCLSKRALALLTAEPEPCEKQSLLFVDATPNDGYVTRILSAYIDDSYYSDNTIGLPPENPLVKQMNEWRKQRNALLRDAISKLNASQVADKRVEELRAAINARDSYISLLIDELNDVVGIASVHGWISHRSKDGELARLRIKAADEALAATEPKPSKESI